MRQWTLVLAACCIGFSGCSSTSGPVNINGKDRSARFYEVEFRKALGDKTEGGPRKTHLELSAGYAHGEGAFEQGLGNGEFVVVDSTQISGPVMLTNSVELDVAYLRGVLHAPVSDALELFGGLGLGSVKLDLTTTDGNQQTSVSEDELNFHSLIGIAYHFSPLVGLEGSVGYFSPIFPNFDFAALDDTRIQLFVTPTERLRLFAGYRVWAYQYQYGSGLIEQSDISFRFSGPTAGVMLRF